MVIEGRAGHLNAGFHLINRQLLISCVMHRHVSDVSVAVLFAVSVRETLKTVNSST